jgi:hypothetical protein
MYFLKVRIQSVVCRSGRSAAFLALLAKIQELNLEIEREDAVEGVVIVRCLSLPINWILWRSWSDKLLFEMRGAEGGKAVLNVYAVPNLLRMSLRRDERVVDPRQLMSRLMIEEL